MKRSLVLSAAVMIATLPALAENIPWPKSNIGHSRSFADERNSNTLTGDGLVELLAREMTADWKTAAAAGEKAGWGFSP